MYNLEKSPYSLDETTTQAVEKRLADIEERVGLLRRAGTLTPETLRAYYGEKRFEQVAESNAIEGSTLSVGETQVAVLKGITLSGHDPAYQRDAISLDRALTRAAELARTNSATDIPQLLDIHGLLLGERQGAGILRSEPVRITGTDHRPPKTREAVLTATEAWEEWSKINHNTPAPIRAAVLHAWLTHIHPFIDGNGRTSRAIGNIELIRVGYPPIIIKKTERDRYIDALRESDTGGDLRAFLDLIFDKVEASLRGLEISAKAHQGYDPLAQMAKERRQQNLKIWQTGVTLLASMIDVRLSERIARLGGGRSRVKIMESPLDLEDYEVLAGGGSISGGWAFIVSISISGFPQMERLAYVQHRQPIVHQYLGREGGPALYWSHKNPSGFPKWASDRERSPYTIELTSRAGNGDEWVARLPNNTIQELTTSEAADRISEALLQQTLEQTG